MDNRVFVAVVHSREHLAKQNAKFVLSEVTVVSDKFQELSLANTVHCEHIVAVCLKNIVKLHNVGVVEEGQKANLSPKTLFLLLCQLKLGNEFQGNLSTNIPPIKCISAE